jgi:hypothetical protein
LDEEKVYVIFLILISNTNTNVLDISEIHLAKCFQLLERKDAM